MLEEGDKYTLPQDFLMDMMDVNEALMELEFDPDAAKSVALKTQILSIEKQLTDELEALTSSYDDIQHDHQESVLKAIKDLYYRNKYLIRIKESLDKQG